MPSHPGVPSKIQGALALGVACAALPLSAADQRALPVPPPVVELREAEAPPASEGDYDLRLVWFDPQGVMPARLPPVEQEVTTIFRRLGVRVRWSRGEVGTVLGEDEPGPPEIPLILLPDDPAPRRSARHVMGLVPKEPVGTRPVWLFLSNIRWTLGQKPSKKTLSEAEQADLALAMARVIAHEVVHAVAPREPHSLDGLMHRSLDRSFLVGPEAFLDPDCAEAFLKSLALLKAPASTPATAQTGSAHRLAAP